MDLSRELDATDGMAMAPAFTVFCAQCAARGYDADAIALAAMVFGARLMTETKNSPLFTIQCLERAASQQLVDFHDLAVAEVAAIETKGSA